MTKTFDKRYERYHIDTHKVPNILEHPHRFNVKVNRFQLAKLLLSELVHYRGNLRVVKSRPCVYGVFSGPVGGFAPRERLCVGCLRCTVQYPEMVTISPNPERLAMGDEYFLPDYVDAILYESEAGRIPVRGAGYRGKFGGQGWDAMWTDMSEIVRPTRDGIHGREYISTEVDLGGKLSHLKFDEGHRIDVETPPTLVVPLPILLDPPPRSQSTNLALVDIWAQTAHQLQSYALIPIESIHKDMPCKPSVIPIVTPDQEKWIEQLHFEPSAIEMDGWNESLYNTIKHRFPTIPVILRERFETPNLLEAFDKGIRSFHLTANYHGRGVSGAFILDLIRKAHAQFVNAKVRDQVTLIGSGGIVAAEHMPKAILCGLDLIALDTPLQVALQAKMQGSCVDWETSHFILPEKMTHQWAVQRLVNLAASWRDQLLEIMGAMGLREVRRLRGEMGRAMFQHDLEQEAFSGIEGYPGR